MSEQEDVYHIFLKEIEMVMHQSNVKSNHELSELMERKAFDMNIHPKLASALVNYYWSGVSFGLGKAFVIMKEKENVETRND